MQFRIWPHILWDHGSYKRIRSFVHAHKLQGQRSLKPPIQIILKRFVLQLVLRNQKGHDCSCHHLHPVYAICAILPQSHEQSRSGRRNNLYARPCNLHYSLQNQCSCRNEMDRFWPHHLLCSSVLDYLFRKLEKLGIERRVLGLLNKIHLRQTSHIHIHPTLLGLFGSLCDIPSLSIQILLVLWTYDIQPRVKSLPQIRKPNLLLHSQRPSIHPNHMGLELPQIRMY